MKGPAVIALILIVIIGTAFLAYPIMLYFYGPIYNQRPYQGYSMMTYYGKTVPVNEAMIEALSVTSYVKVFPANDTAVINSTYVKLTVYAMMGSMAEKITGQKMPAYAHGYVFVIYGLIYPTLVFNTAGRLVTLIITLINLNDDMYHNFVLTVQSPPYSYMVGPGMMSFSGGFMEMMPYLPPTSNGNAYTYSYSVQLRGQNTFWYICTYPGHAENGMYGEIVIT